MASFDGDINLNVDDNDIEEITNVKYIHFEGICSSTEESPIIVTKNKNNVPILIFEEYDNKQPMIYFFRLLSLQDKYLDLHFEKDVDLNQESVDRTESYEYLTPGFEPGFVKSSKNEISTMIKTSQFKSINGNLFNELQLISHSVCAKKFLMV